MSDERFNRLPSFSLSSNIFFLQQLIYNRKLISTSLPFTLLMKILQLELIAFGGFTHTVLDFSKKPTGLHIVYGDNEAGKSTLRCALTHLLFGIPVDVGRQPLADFWG